MKIIFQQFYFGDCFKHGVPHWCTYWCTLVFWYFGKVKIFFQWLTYLLFILNSNMYWLKYIRCEISTQRDLIFRGLFASFFYQDDFLWILRTILSHCYLIPRLVYHFNNFDHIASYSANWNSGKHFGETSTEYSPSSWQGVIY